MIRKKDFLDTLTSAHGTGERDAIRLPYSDRELETWCLSRCLVLPDGTEAEVVMTVWHWDVLRWLLVEKNYLLPDILGHVLRLRREETLSQTLQWWIECCRDSYAKLEADGLA